MNSTLMMETILGFFIFLLSSQVLPLCCNSVMFAYFVACTFFPLLVMWSTIQFHHAYGEAMPMFPQISIAQHNALLYILQILDYVG
jgi:hypothetical protein